MIIEYGGKRPQIGRNVFIAPTAVLIGAITVADGASIWYNTVVRGDMEPITIGRDTNIQDNCTLHTDDGYPLVIGARVSVGHNAVVHGCRVGEGCLIGIGATVLTGADIGRQAVVAAGSVIREGQRVGERQLVAGIPATLKRDLDDDALEGFAHPVRNYIKLSAGHRAALAAHPSEPTGTDLEPERSGG